MARIAVLGSASGDYYMEVARMPRVGETLQATDSAIRAGGKGANQAAAAGKLGGRSVFLGQLGGDANRDLIMGTLRAATVDVSQIITLPEMLCGQAMIFLMPSGENSIVIVGGTNIAWQGVPETMKETIRASSILLLQREIPEVVNIEAAQVAKSAGKMVVLDVGGREEPMSQELLSLVDIISPNETELIRLTGIEDVDEACRWLQTHGVKHVLLKLGSQGSRYISPDFTCTQAALSRPDLPIVDTTGAGDCFTAAFVVRLLELGGVSESSVGESLRFASAAAFLGITKKGAMESIPARGEVDQFLAQL